MDLYRPDFKNIVFLHEFFPSQVRRAKETIFPFFDLWFFWQEGILKGQTIFMMVRTFSMEYTEGGSISKMQTYAGMYS